MHKVLNVRLIAHVPARQIGDSYLIKLPKVILALDDCSLELLINVDFRWSEWVAIYQDDLDCELVIWLSDCDMALEHEQV